MKRMLLPILTIFFLLLAGCLPSNVGAPAPIAPEPASPLNEQDATSTPAPAPSADTVSTQAAAPMNGQRDLPDDPTTVGLYSGQSSVTKNVAVTSKVTATF